MDPFCVNLDRLRIAHPRLNGVLPKIKTITYRQIAEDNTRVTELLTGNADLVNNVPPALATKVKAEPKTELQTVRGLRNVYLKINTKKAPFSDLKVRQAINHAI